MGLWPTGKLCKVEILLMAAVSALHVVTLTTKMSILGVLQESCAHPRGLKRSEGLATRQ